MPLLFASPMNLLDGVSRTTGESWTVTLSLWREVWKKQSCPHAAVRKLWPQGQAKLAVSSHSPMTWQLRAVFPHCPKPPVPFALPGICVRELGGNVWMAPKSLLGETIPSGLRYLLKEHPTFNWCLCCCIGSPTGRGNQAQVSKLMFTVFLYGLCCASLAAFLAKEGKYSFGKDVSFQHADFGHSLPWPVSQGGPAWGWYSFQKCRTLMRLFDVAQLSGIGPPLPHSLKLNVHKP